MPAHIVPLTSVPDAVAEVLRCAMDHVDAVNRRSLEDTESSYVALVAAVEAHARARAAHTSSIDSHDTPSLAILDGGLPS